MKWKTFKEEMPQEDRLILYGNHRFVEVNKFKKTTDINKMKLAFKPVTHWCYIELPPIIDQEVT